MGTDSEKDPILEERIGSSDGVIERLKILIGDTAVYAKSTLWGIPNSTIATILSRGAKRLSMDIALKIAESEGVNLYWLATGKGPMYTRQAATELSAPPEFDHDFVMVRDMSNVEAAAGGGSYVTDEESTGRIAFRREWVEREGLRPQALRIIRARGDSMEPTIQSGAAILVEVFAYADEDGRIRYTRSGSSPEQVVQDDGVYVIQLNDRLLVKRLQLDMMGGLLVMSDNSSYQSIHIPAADLGELAVVGRVVWTGRKL